MIPAPMIHSEYAIWNWWAMKAPDDIPDTDRLFGSMWSGAASVSKSAACSASSARSGMMAMPVTALRMTALANLLTQYIAFLRPRLRFAPPGERTDVPRRSKTL
jgi:hypothetical protein